MNLLQRALGLDGLADLFSDEALIAAMLRFDVELAQAQASLGIIPEASARAMRSAADTFAIDADLLAKAGAHAGVVVVPFVNALRAHVEGIDAIAKTHVHFGVTSQDVLDTALALQTVTAVSRIQAQLDASAAAAASLARTHRDTPILARTLLQAAGVTTFGYKAAQWHTALRRAQRRLHDAASLGLAVALGGALGNVAAFDEDKGQALRAHLAQSLGLRDPGLTWHTDRQDWIAVATAAALACGCMGKIAQDIALLAQSEVDEVSEPSSEGRGVSSAMPHKRNPVLSMRIMAATQPVPGIIANLLAAMPQAHERALGNWQAELASWPLVFAHAHCAAQSMAELLCGLQVNEASCRANIEAIAALLFSADNAVCSEYIQKAAAASSRLVDTLLRVSVAD